MLITAVEERKKGMVALFADGEYAACLDQMTLLGSGFGVGKEISEEQLEQLKERSLLSRAKEKALNLIEYRGRTRRELLDKLTPLYGEEAAELAVERLEELGLIDDEAFAREYAEQLLHKKLFSGQRALYEMMKKGIDRELAEEILEELEPEPEEQILRLLETKYARVPRDEKGRNKIVNGLKAMGFSWYDIRSAMADEFE